MALIKTIDGVDYKISYDENGKETNRVRVDGQKEDKLSQQYGARSFEGLDILPGEKSGETKARESRFREHVYDWRENPGYQQMIKGKGARVSDIPQIEKNYLFFNPEIGAPRVDFGTEGNRRWNEWADTNLDTYSPPKDSPTASGTQNQLNRAIYDLGYAKSALNISRGETESVRRGVGGEQERTKVEQERFKTRQRGEELGITTEGAIEGKTIVNPEFTNLTANQKILNAQRKAKGESFIPDSISAESGRAPIKDKLSKQNKLSAQELSRTVSALGDDSLKVLSANFDLLSPSQKAAARDFLNTKAQGNMLSLVQEISENVKEELTIKEQKIRADLNMSPEDVLTFTDDGEPLINKKSVTQDAIDRANEDVQEAKDDWNEIHGEAHENELARITMDNTVNGELTDDGRALLAKAERDYKRIKDNQFEEIDDNLQEYENKQKSRQADVDLQIARGNSVEGKLKRQLAQDKATGAFNIQKEQARIGQTIGFDAAIKEYEKRTKSAIKDPSYGETASALDTKIFTEGFDRATAFDTAVSAFNNNVKNAEKYMKERGFTEKDIATQKREYQVDVLGYSPEEVAEEQKSGNIKNIALKGLRGETLTQKEADDLLIYKNTKPEEYRKIELAVTTDLSSLEISLQVEREFEKPKKAKVEKEKELSSAGKLFIEENKDFDVYDINKDSTEYGLSSTDKTILEDMVYERFLEEKNTPEEIEAVKTIKKIPEEKKEGFWSKIKNLFKREKTTIGTQDIDNISDKDINNMSLEELNALEAQL